MADLSTLEIIKASEKPTAEDFSYIYAESGNKAFIRIAKDKLKEIINEGNYTNEEIDQKISSIPKFNIEVVSSLPTTDISETTIYLVSSGDDSENLYTEYININGLWEILGTQKASFSGSAKDVTYDDTQTNLGATNVQGAIGKLSETVNDLKENGTGTTVTGGSVKTILANIMTIMKAQVQINADGTTTPQAYSPDISAIASQTDRLIANLGTTDDGGEEEPDTPVEPDEPEVTLSSISVTYTGGDVIVGTALTDLTGIVVTAHYSDGSTATVTGYTLSGEIVEGSNTITVTYNGLTTTFAVTGVVEEQTSDVGSIAITSDQIEWGYSYSADNDPSVGNLTYNETFLQTVGISDYIEVPNTYLFTLLLHTGISTRCYCYDENKNYLGNTKFSGLQLPDVTDEEFADFYCYVVEAIENTKFVRFNINYNQFTNGKLLYYRID